MIPIILGKMANKSVMAMGLIMYLILPLRPLVFLQTSAKLKAQYIFSAKNQKNDKFD